jgi:hypothetical protein
LVINTIYNIRYRAKNIFGWSEYSAVTQIKTIMVPDIASAVASELIGTNVVFTWDQPDARGATI